MGEVWKAEHRFLARPAAVKLIRPDRLGDPASESAVHAVQRFEREAQTTASLRSVHTVGLYDFGRSNLGALYYVMELLEGFDMETLVERFGPQPPARVVYWLEQVCHSLTEAHAKGLVHRDIKPANLFVCRYGCDFDFVKVLDFGMVSLQPSLAGQDANLTVEGRIHGTPAYLAPEVVTGDAQPDAQSDIYALGCVAYFLLSGELVFKGKTPVEVIVGHVERAPAPLSQVAEQTIPVAFERLVLQCLAKDPTERPDGVEAVMVALEGCRGDDLWAAEQARQWWETHAEGVERSSAG
jgi:serine/threonine-protein kinase